MGRAGAGLSGCVRRMDGRRQLRHFTFVGMRNEKEAAKVCLGGLNRMPSPAPKPLPTREDRRAKREARRAKQREENVGRAAKMHTDRIVWQRSARPQAIAPTTPSKAQVHVGCSGWFYWHWRGDFYPAGLPTKDWFGHYSKQFGTVELNAPFYSWPTVAAVRVWLRQIGRRSWSIRSRPPNSLPTSNVLPGRRRSSATSDTLPTCLAHAWDVSSSNFRPVFIIRPLGWSASSRNSILPAATSWSSGTEVGGMTAFSPPSARPGPFFAPAAPRGYPKN